MYDFPKLRLYKTNGQVRDYDLDFTDYRYMVMWLKQYGPAGLYEPSSDL